MIIRITLVLILIMLLTLPGAAQQSRWRQMHGVPKEEPGEDLSHWGEGDGFEDIFDAVVVRASSSLKSSGGNDYGAKCAHDDDLKTAWVEGSPGDGIGEYLEYILTPHPDEGRTDRAVMGLTVFNGYRKSPALWKENGRIHRLRLDVNGKPYGVITLADTYRYQTVDIGRIALPPHGKIVLRFTILSVYPGTKYHDTALTELEFSNGLGIY